MLVLFVTDKDGNPLTMETMKERFDKRYEQLKLGKFLFHDVWYKNEPFFKNDGLVFSWKLITKQCIPNSKDKRHHHEPGDPFPHQETQAYVIEQFADQVDIPLETLHRPTPAEHLFAIAVHRCATKQKTGTGQRIFEHEWHWSEVLSSDGYFVLVGYADVDGVYVNRRSREDRDGWMGVCVSRDASENP